MNIRNKKALVTGAGSGIGYAIAKRLKQYGNEVIIVGRNRSKIEKAADELNVKALVCDVSKEEEVLQLAERIKNDYPQISILVNNAGVANLYKLGEDANAFQKASYEFSVNYFAPLLLTEKLLPILKKQPEAAIINITSNVTFHPLVVLPTYSDTKSALHSHTVALRLGLSETGVNVFEVMPSLVNTDATKDMGGENGILPDEVAEKTIQGLLQDEYEIYVGDTGKQRAAYFKNPVAATAQFNAGL